MQKQCTVCGVLKPLDQFYRNAERPDGRRNECKACRRVWALARRDITSAYSAQWYAANRERIAALRRRVRIEQADRIRAEERAWYEADPERARLMYRAKTAVGRAVAKGRLVRPDACEQCGATGVAITGAHEDYHRPLDVRWLCWACHIRWDRAQPKLTSA